MSQNSMCMFQLLREQLQFKFSSSERLISKNLLTSLFRYSMVAPNSVFPKQNSWFPPNPWSPFSQTTNSYPNKKPPGNVLLFSKPLFWGYNRHNLNKLHILMCFSVTIDLFAVFRILYKWNHVVCTLYLASYTQHNHFAIIHAIICFNSSLLFIRW